MKYYDDPEKNRQVQNYLRSRKRAAQAKPGSVRLRCQNGPWAGYELALTNIGRDNISTASLRIGDQVGRYVEKDYWLHWVPELRAVS